MDASFINELSRQYCGYNTDHKLCVAICTKIQNNLDKVKDYKKLLESVIAFLSRQTYSYATSCCRPENINLLKTLLNLVPLEDLPISSLNILANSNTYLTTELIKIVKERKNINGELLNNLIGTNNYSIYIELKSKNDIVYTTEILTHLCFTMGLRDNSTRHGQVNTSDAVKLLLNNYILELVNENIPVTRESIIGAILTKKSLDVIKQLITMGPEIKIDYLEAAFFSHYEEAIEFFLDNKIMPNSKCIALAFSDRIYNTDGLQISDKIMTYFNNNINSNSLKIHRPSSLKAPSSINIHKKLIDIILATGYKLTYDDLYLITKNYVTLDSVDQYDIKFDDNFIELCSNIGFYPKYNKSIKPGINSLRKECSKYGNLPMIRELITKEQIKPDEICLENACKYKGNIATIRYLVSTHKVPITLVALQNMIRSNANSASCYIVDEFINQENKKSKSGTTKVIPKKIIDSDSDSESDIEPIKIIPVKKLTPAKKLAEKYKKIKKVLGSDSSSESSSDSSSESSSESSSDSSSESSSDSSSESSSDSSSESEDEPVKITPAKKTEKPAIIAKPVETGPPVVIKSKKIISKKKVDTDDKITKIKEKEKEVKQKFTELKVDISELHNLEPVKKEPVKINYTDVQTKISDSENIQVPLKMSKYFKLEKDAKISVLSLKKLLLNQLNTLKLIEKGKFEIILPNDLISALNYDVSKYGKVINIKTIDKFCAIVLENIKKNCM